MVRRMRFLSTKSKCRMYRATSIGKLRSMTRPIGVSVYRYNDAAKVTSLQRQLKEGRRKTSNLTTPLIQLMVAVIWDGHSKVKHVEAAQDL